MAAPERLQVLLGQISDAGQALGAIEASFRRFLLEDLPEIGKRDVTASRLCDILEHYYTCAETIFLRVSRFFENDLAPQKWHQDLLDKMRLEVPGIRPAVLGQRTHELLQSLLRFRHFRRYYFSLSYDWGDLDLLGTKLEELLPLLRADLDTLSAFVAALNREH